MDYIYLYASSLLGFILLYFAKFAIKMMLWYFIVVIIIWLNKAYGAFYKWLMEHGIKYGGRFTLLFQCFSVGKGLSNQNPHQSNFSTSRTSII